MYIMEKMFESTNQYMERGLVTLQQIHLKHVVVWVKNDQLPKTYGLDWSNALNCHKPKIRLGMILTTQGIEDALLGLPQY